MNSSRGGPDTVCRMCWWQIPPQLGKFPLRNIAISMALSSYLRNLYLVDDFLFHVGVIDE